MTLVKVYTDVGGEKPVTLYAKIFKKLKRNNYQIKYLSPTNISYNGKTLYNYENVIYEVDESSITEHLNTDDEEVIGFSKVEDGFVKISDSDSESEYEPSEEESEEESDDVSLDESEEEFYESGNED